MKLLLKVAASTAATTLLITPLSAQAEGLYGNLIVGLSEQGTDSEAYGDNIAADPDFPRGFDSGDGEVLALGIGWDFEGPLRVEGRVGYREGDINDRKIGTGARAGEEYILDGSIESTTLTVEGFYDFSLAEKVGAYVKAGVGISDNEYSARLGGAGAAGFDSFDGVIDGFYAGYADGSSTEFAWNIGVGGSYALNEKFSLFGEYQYFDLGEGETGQDPFTDGFRVDATANEFQLGLRMNF